MDGIPRQMVLEQITLLVLHTVVEQALHYMPNGSKMLSYPAWYRPTCIIIGIL